MIDLNHPNPIQSRENYQILNGKWEFIYKNIKDYTDEDIVSMKKLPSVIEVPFTLESKSSGINNLGNHEKVAYAKNFKITEQNKKVYLIFNGVDYESRIYINGVYIQSHIGGYTPIEVDLSQIKLKSENRIVIIVEDSLNRGIMRGKQRWEEKNHECWYNTTIGIWKTVYLEYRGFNEIRDLIVTPNIDGTVLMNGKVTQASNYILKVFKEDKLIYEIDGKVENNFEIQFKLDNPKLWDFNNPHLYEYDLMTNDDYIHGYFGFRKIHEIGRASCRERV